MIKNYYLRDPQSYEDKDTKKRVFTVSTKDQKETSIILFVTFGKGPKGRLKYYTNEHVKPCNWNFNKQECTKDAKVNVRLGEIYRAVDDAYNKLVKANITVTQTTLKNALLEELKRDNASHEVQLSEDNSKPIETLYDLITRFTEVRQSLRAKGTMQRYQALQTHLLAYEAKFKTVVKLSAINIEFADAFASYLYAKGHQRNTVGKLFIGLKVVLNWGVSSGYQIPPHYKKFVIPTAPSKIIALTETEFYRFLTVELPESEQVTRDLFCFSAFTGLRYSDVVRITPEMINGNWLTITTRKTEDALRVYLLPEAIDILSKYKFRFKGLRTNQGANKGVKKIAELAGIDEPIKITKYYGNKTVDETIPKYDALSFHCAKKTHVTLSLKNGVRPEVLSEQIGNTLRTLKPYIAIADIDKQNSITQAFKKVKKVGTQLRKTA